MEYKVGDRIKITKVFYNDFKEDEKFFFDGDIGIIIADKDKVGDYLVDFNNQGNPKVVDEGIWYVRETTDNPFVKVKFVLVNSLYEKGEKILVSVEDLEYVERFFHSYEDQGVWCHFNSNDRALRFWPYHKKMEVKVEKKEEKLPRFHEAQVGDLVYNRLHGYRTIDEIIPTDDYPLKVDLNGIRQHSFSLDGRVHSDDAEPTWFYANPKDHDDKYLEERPNEAYSKPIAQEPVEWIGDNCSNRGKEWLRFSDVIMSHIESYTVPQYKDAPEDQAEEWTAEDCFKSIERYLNRRNSQSREGQELMDIKKMAHYLCLAYFKKEAGK